ncbi:MAG: XdhC family protein [Candidatus Eisenbacteria bacterium]
MVIDDCMTLFAGTHLLKTYQFARSGPDSTGMCCGGEAEVFMELFAKPDRLVIFGGGHIARELASVVSGLDFRITVVDDRPEMLEQYRGAAETVLTDAEYHEGLPGLDEHSYVVIVTRSHNLDRSILARVIRSGCAYLGMIGSKAKVAETFAFLKAFGVEESLFEKVRTPIGLDIGAEGPREIAVSMAAELIAARRKAHPDSGRRDTSRP